MARKLIFKYRSDGSMLPKYIYCKVYNDGTLEAGDGYIFDNKDEHHAIMKLPRSAIRDIERIIDRNFAIFNIDKIENPGPMILDGTTETLYFSDERQKCSFKIDNLGIYDEGYKNLLGAPEASNYDLVVSTYKEIRKILIDNGLNSELF